MFATLLTLAFATAALFALATLGASLAKGLAVAAALRGESAGRGAFRTVTVRSASTSAGLSAARPLTAGRAPRRPVRPVLAQARCPQRVAA